MFTAGGALIWVLGIVIVAVVAVAAVIIGIYNRLVQLRSRVDNAWSQIDVQLRQRYDLVPGLIESVKKYAEHEKTTLENVTKARQLAMDAKTVAEQGQAENVLTSTLRSLFAVAEQYPDLKASQNFLQFSDQLSGLESKIAYARQFYNDAVMMYNMATEQFPSNLIAGSFGFAAREYFEIEEAAKQPVEVKL
jgi:LemA protein